MTAAAALDDGLPARFETKEAAGLVAGGSCGIEKVVRMSGSLMEQEFPFEFGMLRSEVSSPVESLESEEESEEDEFFAMLNQRLSLCDSKNLSFANFNKSPEGFEVSGGSPQSTLGGIESWSGRSSNGSNRNSPPATPFESTEDTLGLIYAAAGQVDRLERNVEDPLQASLNGQWKAVAKPKPLQNPNAGFYAEQMKRKYMAAARRANEAALFWEVHLQNMKMSETYSNPSHAAAIPEQLQQCMPNFEAVPLQRKESAGTGVFIPRSYNTSSSVQSRKRTVAPCALVPAKVVQALNTSIETMSASRPHCNPLSSSTSPSQHGYDAVMARRRALLDQQQRSMVRRSEDISSRSLEACLPQEWSY